MSRLALPIDPLLPRITEELSRAAALVLQASPGSGKTTRVPPALAKTTPGQVIVLEPRRLAAKYAASRVAEEEGVRVGEEIGYQFRFENRSSARTKILFLTEGMLMRRMLSDPELKGVGIVILDEFHERHLHGDVALAFLRHLQKSRRPDLKLVVMSATLDTESVSTYLGGAQVLSLAVPLYPVKIEHAPGPLSRALEVEVRNAVAGLVEGERRAESGDILVFLPGMAEIRRCEEALREIGARSGSRVLPLHGELAREEQDRALAPAKERRIILSTNVAETSLTIPGVRSVVDSGLARSASYSWWSGVPRLRTRPISKASAIQRTGRAGRTAPGICVRLYPKGDYDGRAPFETPEVRRADLAQTVLELKSLGIHDPVSFDWFEKPAETSLRSSEELLLRLGAQDDSGRITERGKRMVAMPAHPRIARMMIEAEALGCAEDAATLAALIAEGELSSADAHRDLASARRDERLSRVRTQLLSSLKKESSPAKALSGGRPAPKGADSVSRAALAGFPDRVARRKSPTEAMLCTGGSARLFEKEQYPDGELWVALDVQERQAHGQARSSVHLRSAVAIDEEWLWELENTLLSEKEVEQWDSEKKRVFESSQLAYGELVLSETVRPPRNRPAAAGVLARNALGLDLSQPLSAQQLVDALRTMSGERADEMQSLVARLKLARESVPRLGVPELDGAQVASIVRSILEPFAATSELVTLEWESAFLDKLSELAPELDRYGLDRELPTHVQLHPGRKARVQYSLEQGPWVESRLQDFFGLKQGPSIAGGRIPLTLHLLAPNQRAVQVTRDLAGFWARAYREVRNELMRRYPRHSWPEDPLTAPPPQPGRRRDG